MRLNWGNGILITFILFCSFIIAIVWKSFQHDVNLVSEQYYQEELAYQDRIDAIKNSQALGEKVQIKVNGKINVKLPDTDLTEGTIHFYRPDNAKLDRVVPITDLESEIAVALLEPGRYKAKVTWKDGSKTYFDEQDVLIP